jgi:hypothetical protein
MVWKTWNCGSFEPAAPSSPVKRPRQEGNLIGYVGNITGGVISRNRNAEHLERLPVLADELLGYNLEGNLVLVRVAQNERSFDHYVALPFTKGVTERETGRTLLILGSNAHHGEAMQGQFAGAVWPDPLEERVKKYGNTLRWINVGDTREGFIGLDYNPQAEVDAGVAQSFSDIAYLASTLLEQGFDSGKRLYLLKPPYIREREEGAQLRRRGFITLGDYAAKEALLQKA